MKTLDLHYTLLESLVLQVEQKRWTRSQSVNRELATCRSFKARGHSALDLLNCNYCRRLVHVKETCWDGCPSVKTKFLKPGEDGTQRIHSLLEVVAWLQNTSRAFFICQIAKGSIGLEPFKSDEISGQLDSMYPYYPDPEANSRMTSAFSFLEAWAD